MTLCLRALGGKRHRYALSWSDTLIHSEPFDVKIDAIGESGTNCE